MRKEIGKRLKMVREKKRITQAELGKKLGIKFQHVSKYERGETVPTWENLIKLNDLYDVNINWLLTGRGKMFLSPITYATQGEDQPQIVRDLEQDEEIAEIISELRNDQELKDLIYGYIKNYRYLRITTAKLNEKINKVSRKL